VAFEKSRVASAAAQQLTKKTAFNRQTPPQTSFVIVRLGQRTISAGRGRLCTCHLALRRRGFFRFVSVRKRHLDYGHCLLRLPDANGQPTM
jgi:hypothetical protein